MISLSAQIEDKTKRVSDAAAKGAFRNFSHGAAAISKDAKGSLETAAGPSLPGSPPHTHKGAFLRRAVRYAADKDGAIIGPIASIVGEAGEAHEFGGSFHGNEYPERPFMGPALERNTDRFADSWQSSIGE